MTVHEAERVQTRFKQKIDVSSVRKVILLRTTWYPEVVDALESSAQDYLISAGVPVDGISVHAVPGSFELPLAAQLAIQKQSPDFVVALGCIVEGGTPHFHYVCQAVTNALMQVQLETGVPVGFGVLTVNTLEQALERKNKGAEAAAAALMMALKFKGTNK